MRIEIAPIAPKVTTNVLFRPVGCTFLPNNFDKLVPGPSAWLAKFRASIIPNITVILQDFFAVHLAKGRG